MVDVFIQRDQGTGTHKGTPCEDMGEDGICTRSSKASEELAIALITSIRSAKL